ncbi:MAG: hypothetical protein ACRAUZ_11985 [Aeromonas jandaei]
MTTSQLEFVPFPYADAAYDYAGQKLADNWERLHQGDAEPWPEDEQVQDAWRAYHAGDFAQAVALGEAAGEAGLNVANKALVIHASYLLEDKYAKRAAFERAASHAEKLQKRQPDNANAWYFHALALGRYSQVISISKALSQGIGDKIKASLEKALELEPDHAEAHIAFGAWHAEIVDKLGAMIGGLTYGAKKEESERHFKEALALSPDSAIARMEYANAQVMLHGKSRLKAAEALYAEAAECEPMDAMERLDVEAAREELED